MNYISLSKIALYMNVSEDYLAKTFNSCGLMRLSSYSVNHLAFVRDNLICGNYRRKVFVMKLDTLLTSLNNNFPK